MSINDLHVELATAVPEEELKRASSGKGRTIFGDIQTDRGRKSAYIKLLSTELIAKEALCAVLAKKLYLPITQPYYVNISAIEHQLDAVNSEKVAFGLERSRWLPAREFRTSTAEEELLKWPDLLRCGVFDEWVGNTDRTYKNIAYERSGQLWIFDHDETLPSYLSPSVSIRSGMLALAAREKSEFELYKLRDQAMSILDEFIAVDWDEIFEFVLPEQLHGGGRLFKRHIEFLRNRVPYMRDLITQDLGIKQKEMPLTKIEHKKPESL